MAKKDETSGIGCLVLILLTVVILAVGFAIGAAYVLLQVMWITLPAWGVAVLLIVLSTYIYCIFRIRHLQREKYLADIISIHVGDGKLSFVLRESELAQYAKTLVPMFFSILAAAIWCGAVIYFLHTRIVFNQVTWWFYSDTTVVSPIISMILSILISCVVIILTPMIIKPKYLFKNLLERKMHRNLKHINNSTKRLGLLADFDRFFDAINEPSYLRADVQYFINTNRKELLSESDEVIERLNDLITEKIKQAEQRKSMHYHSDERYYQKKTASIVMIRKEAYKLLEVDKNATKEEIKKAYRTAVKKWNVDQRQHLEPHIREKIEEQFKKVNLAFEILTK